MFIEIGRSSFAAGMTSHGLGHTQLSSITAPRAKHEHVIETSVRDLNKCT